MSEERIHALIVKGQHIPVTQTVYKAYYQVYEHERYLNKKSVAYEHSLEQLLAAGVSIDFRSADSPCPIEDQLIAKEQTQKLYHCLMMLAPEEKQIIISRKAPTASFFCALFKLLYSIILICSNN